MSKLVYVLDINGKPLMPTKKNGMVRRYLRDGIAKIVKREPFTIQLLKHTSPNVQPVILGCDVGGSKVGFSAGTEKEELFSARQQVRTDVSNNIKSRQELRRNRRNRKTRYRPARFNNRKNRKGKIPPSSEVILINHLRVIELICSILPVSKIILEVGQFDPHKIKAEEEGIKLKGKDYQLGEQYGFQNVKQYVLERDNHTCQICNKNKGSMEVHHIRFKSKGGSDRPGNLICLCKECHSKLHKEVMKPKHNKKWDLKPTNKSLKGASLMNQIKDRLVKEVSSRFSEVEVEITYGYITKIDRMRFGLEKDHHLDAYSIVYGILGFNKKEPVLQAEHTYQIKSFRRHRRDLRDPKTRKGNKVKLRIPVNEVKGFHLYDLVEVVGDSKYKGAKGFITCLRKTGSFEIKDIDGKKLIGGISSTKLKRIMYNSSFYII